MVHLAILCYKNIVTLLAVIAVSPFTFSLSKLKGNVSAEVAFYLVETLFLGKKKMGEEKELVKFVVFYCIFLIFLCSGNSRNPCLYVLSMGINVSPVAFLKIVFNIMCSV